MQKTKQHSTIKQIIESQANATALRSFSLHSLEFGMFVSRFIKVKHWIKASTVCLFPLLTSCGISIAPGCDYSGGGIEGQFSVFAPNAPSSRRSTDIIIASGSMDTMFFHVDSTTHDTVIPYLQPHFYEKSSIELRFSDSESVKDSITISHTGLNTLYMGANPFIETTKTMRCRSIIDSNKAIVAKFCNADRCQ